MTKKGTSRLPPPARLVSLGLRTNRLDTLNAKSREWRLPGLTVARRSQLIWTVWRKRLQLLWNVRRRICEWSGTALVRFCTHNRVRQVSGLRRDPAVSVEDLTHTYIFHWKIYSDPLARILCEQFEVISDPHRILARGSESIFEWDIDMCEVLYGNCGVPT